MLQRARLLFGSLHSVARDARLPVCPLLPPKARIAPSHTSTRPDPASRAHTATHDSALYPTVLASPRLRRLLFLHLNPIQTP